jgi:queuine tRNA-ribosyltransferase
MAESNFRIEKKMGRGLGRVGILSTPHGSIQTPAFIPVGTKATVKALTPEHVVSVGAQAVLANTYHLYLAPGPDILASAKGLGNFMNWKGPTFTDSGGFQVFSLGVAFGKRQSKVGKNNVSDTSGDMISDEIDEINTSRLAKVDEEGVTFRSHIDGSEHRFTPEVSIGIQNQIGADIIFAFDECPSPTATASYQREAMERTHRWAKRSLEAHIKVKKQGSAGTQALFGIVQGGRFEALRRESAQIVGAMDFDGFGIGGSFDKEDMGDAVRWVNEELPEDKPRHLLGIGDPLDMLSAVENGCDTFDCVAPTRLGRTGSLYTTQGRINILNARFARDFSPVEKECDCYTCTHFTRAYLAHLFRTQEMLAGTLASIHNLRFLIRHVERMREGILNDSFTSYKEKFMAGYMQKKSTA